MLGRSANGLFWMSRYLERAENTSRLLDVGFRMAVTRGADSRQDEEWRSVLVSIGQDEDYRRVHGEYSGVQVCNFILRDPENPRSVVAMFDAARSNARAVRTSVTREVWEATNEGWLALREITARPVRERNLIEVLGAVRRHTTQVRGAIEGSMLRNEVYNFMRIGTFVERADNTARILDVKYYVLLPSVALVGSDLDNAQWETVLRSVAGDRAYRWLHAGEMDPRGIAGFLVLDSRFPRSLVFSFDKIRDNMAKLAREYGEETRAHGLLRKAGARLHETTIDEVFEMGLHEFLMDFIETTVEIGNAIAVDYRFTA